MSKRLNRELCSWKDVLARLRRIETTWRGIPLSTVDHETYTEAILCNAMILCDLSNRYEGCGLHREHVLWCFSAAHTDVSSMATFLSDAIVLFRSLSGDEGQTCASYADFKHLLLKDHPRVGCLLQPISGAIERYITDPSPATFYPPYQFLSFMTHLTLTGISLSDELEEEFLENEERLRTVNPPSFLIQQMRGVMAEWLQGCVVNETSFMPRHGPGSVAELSGDISLYSKYQQLAVDPLIDYAFKHYGGFDVASFMPCEPRKEFERCSHIVIVPKSMKTMRVISKEPATLQYLQQGVDRIVRKHIRHNRYLSKRIDLQDQSLQRDAALEASRTREFATVDLSAASDSVTYDLVKQVFRDTPLLPFLMALRSRTVKMPSGKVISAAKFAPMGSALCFPIQTLIFACIAECAAHYVYHDTGVLDTRFRVYGDDIIVPESNLETMVFFLKRCGFRINSTKTYSGTNRFRESCGCDAYDGVDVTCLKIGRKFSSRQPSPRSPGSFEGLKDMANSAYVYGFLLLRRYLVDRLVNQTGYLPLFSEDCNIGLFSPVASNFRAPIRRNDKLHVMEVKVARVVSVQSVDSFLTWNRLQKRFDATPLGCNSEEIRLFEWLRATHLRSGDPLADGFTVTAAIGSAGTFLARRWVRVWNPVYLLSI